MANIIREYDGGPGRRRFDGTATVCDGCGLEMRDSLGWFRAYGRAYCPRCVAGHCSPEEMAETRRLANQKMTARKEELRRAIEDSRRAHDFYLMKKAALAGAQDAYRAIYGASWSSGFQELNEIMEET